MTPIACIALLTLFTAAFLGWGYMQLLTQDRHRRELADLLDKHRAEVASLLQRIQAPENAAAEHTAQLLHYEQPKVAAFDNDASYWSAIGHDPLGDAE